jgi:ATP-dependent Lhr-like helicase
MTPDDAALAGFHPAVQAWFTSAFPCATEAQRQGWPALLRGESTLIFAPTGSGKTLTAFLHCLDRLLFQPQPPDAGRCRVLYLSPIKALASDVERNLRLPLAGIRAAATARGDAFTEPEVMLRTGDTAQRERARFARRSADVLITTPESLFLLLTSNAREALRGVETVIVDEIHALVPTKRGAHLALSLERLEHLTGRRLQRIGLSATQRPLGEVARFLGGHDAEGRPRPVTIVDASGSKRLELSVEVPVDDLSRLAEQPRAPGERPSAWAAIHPRLLELVRAHQSTLLFVNSRRVAERLAAALNELAGEVLVHAHHGSLAREQRALIEAQLKAGQVRGLVATSSLELGIDMGAIDLVVQVEAPPSVASALQRVGRAGHQVGASSAGILFPKYRGDLVACAALTGAMYEGAVEATRVPRNPLDLLAQQVVAMVAMEKWGVEAAYELVRRAAPFAELPRASFEGVLDLLSGHYPSDDFAELKARLTWDRLSNTLTTREGARRIAIANGGTIPDRGLYGVFLVGATKGLGRVGELDEEMVFESKPGDTFVLGASTWRIEDITFDRVLVSPAPGQPGRLPFWRGEQVTRPLEFGQRIGRLMREVGQLPREAALAKVQATHGLDARAAKNLVDHLTEQAAQGTVPDDVTLVVEASRDELGSWRVCVLSPLGGQVLAPWAMALAARARRDLGLDVQTMWTNDGFVVRFPDLPQAPDLAALMPTSQEVEGLVLAELSGTALFAARFRENAARALLLPRRRPGQRTPLWQLRKKSSDLLQVAARFPSFPMMLETYRECLSDLFDLPALVELLRGLEQGRLTLRTSTPQTPSPFATALLFGYVANYLYDGDAPLAERRAQALTIDTTQLSELLGDVELRELLDRDAIAQVEALLQRTGDSAAKTLDGVHDLLLKLGDLSEAELSARCAPPELAREVGGLLTAKRVLRLDFAGEARLVPVEYGARYRDALGLTLPRGLPPAFLVASEAPLRDLVLRFARTHGPFPARAVAARYGLRLPEVEAMLEALTREGALLEGAFLPDGAGREWCEGEVLRSIRRRSLARLRREVEPVETAVFARLLTAWQGVTKRRPGLDALLDAVEKLQGLALPASLLERELLPARVEHYLPSDLDALATAGEVVWVGVERSGEHDGKVALYVTDALPRLWRPPEVDVTTLPERQRGLLEALARQGASFFSALHAQVGGGFPQETSDALWALAWQGLVTNDGFGGLRARTVKAPARGGRAAFEQRFRSRRAAPPVAEGRWSLLRTRVGPDVPTDTAWAHAVAQTLLTRYGVVTREVAAAEGLPGGFSAFAAVFRALEESGRVRRGYFVSGVSALQFALPQVLEQLRTFRRVRPTTPEVVRLSAIDPANPWGALLPWPELAAPEGKRLVPMRAQGAMVVLIDGALRAFRAKGGKQVLTWLPEAPAERALHGRLVAEALALEGRRALERKEGALVVEVNGVPATASVLAEALRGAGFTAGAQGFALRRLISKLMPPVDE